MFSELEALLNRDFSFEPVDMVHENVSFEEALQMHLAPTAGLSKAF